MGDQYYSIKVPSRHEIKVKGSRFLAESEPITSVEEAQRVLEKIRKREHAATHHCYAYRVGISDGMKFKYSDDGEPSGTAGRPIYDVLCGRDLTNTIVVVTRYFGGTKLGTGGLARAYGEAARLVIEKSGVRENYVTTSLKVEVEFRFLDQLLKMLPKYAAKQKKAEYSEQVTLELEVRKSEAEALSAEITRLCAGKVKIENNSAA